MPVIFDASDDLYRQWLAHNPNGYVINTRRTMPASYMVLHRAGCAKIRDYNLMARQGGFTERHYIEICSPNVADLREWVRQHGRLDGSFSRECSICKP